MKCVILAAGRGERMMPLTMDKPKVLLKVKGKPLIDHVIDSLPDEVNKVFVVIKYRHTQIMNHLRRDPRVHFVIGSEIGNAESFLKTRKYLKDERFLLIYGDEVPKSENVKRCVDAGLSILTFGGKLDGVMVLDTDIFNYWPRNHQFVSMVQQFMKDHNVKRIPAKHFRGDINTPKDIERLNG